MSKNRTYARPYAKAAFELAQSEHALAKWSDMLAHAAMIASDKQAAALAKDPQFSTKQLVELYLSIGKDLYSAQMQNFIWILGRFKRLTLLPEIAALYEELRALAERVRSVELISAYPLSDKDQEKFVKVLKERMNCNIELHCQVDKSILGGAIIRSQDLVIDGSIRGRLAKLGDAIGIS
ncbi:MAG: F0F1 ATP synthase subunit delta [Proteobacteria bacterium]|nr:F0F1 ATP synthase subunit delta [Pseudomonadota bacterium]